jgi:hypothetical protein
VSGGCGEMGHSRITLAEQETIIRWDCEEKSVNLYSGHPATCRRIERTLGLEPYRVFQFPDGTVTGKDYRMPLASFRWGKKRRTVLSEAERTRRAERMAGTRREKARSVVQTPVNLQGTSTEVDG